MRASKQQLRLAATSFGSLRSRLKLKRGFTMLMRTETTKMGATIRKKTKAMRSKSWDKYSLKQTQ